uniref:Uncharacterized protein n=1 Tax=Glossina austeni TaxID=7395 RepID=A0A1A9VXK0_GLOAU
MKESLCGILQVEQQARVQRHYVIATAGLLKILYLRSLLLPPQLIVNARTLPHPRHNNNATNVMDHRARDDQMLLNKAVYIPSPSPAPPPDGSYYNMNSDRYLSYPPLFVQ